MEFLFTARFNLLELILASVVVLFLGIGVLEKIRELKKSRAKHAGRQALRRTKTNDRCNHEYRYLGTLPGFNEGDHAGSIFRHQCRKCGAETLLDQKTGSGKYE